MSLGQRTAFAYWLRHTIGIVAAEYTMIDDQNASLILRSPRQQPPKCSRTQRKVLVLSSRSSSDIKRRPRVALKLTQKGCCLKGGPNHADAKGWTNRILDAFGTTSSDFLVTEVARIHKALGITGEDGEARANAALAVIDGIRPKNEVEAMLASQMAVTHQLAMEVLGRARRVQHIEEFDSAANAASKLLRTYVLQLEALASLRRGGRQTVQVKHVHVHSGGQAVVGNITGRPKLGGGGSKKNAHQPHIQAVTHAPVTPLRSQDAQGQLVPAARDGEEEMQATRRRTG
jgi:hypothetical protein